jgi:hypothetical protein
VQDVASGLNNAIVVLQVIQAAKDIKRLNETGTLFLGPSMGIVADPNKAEGLEYRTTDAFSPTLEPNTWQTRRKIINGEVYVLQSPEGPWVPEIL